MEKERDVSRIRPRVDVSEVYAWMDNGVIGVGIEYVGKVKRCLSTDEEEELSREEA